LNEASGDRLVQSTPRSTEKLSDDPGLGPGLAGPGPVVATAQPAPARTGAPSDRSTEFVAAQGGEETSSAEGLLVAAYLVMWAILFGFLLLGWRRQQRVDQRVQELEKALTRVENKAAE
jgi:hypothetical protein